MTEQAIETAAAPVLAAILEDLHQYASAELEHLGNTMPALLRSASRDVQDAFAALEARYHGLIARIDAHRNGLVPQRHRDDLDPARVTVTATREDGTMTDTYQLGEAVYLTATVDNAADVELNDFPGSWGGNPDGSTLTLDTAHPDQAVLTNLPVGDFSVTFNVTKTDGTTLSGTYSATVVDTTPATVTVTGSATAPPNETPAAAA